MSVKVGDLVIIILGFILRLGVKYFVGFEGLTAITYSSLNSWNSILEAISMSNDGISIYDSDSIHQPPVALLFWSMVYKILRSNVTVIFLALEFYCFYLLGELHQRICKYYLNKQSKEVAEYHSTSQSLILSAKDLAQSRSLVLLVYAFNPYSILSFVSQSTSILPTILILKSMIDTIDGRIRSASVLTAILAYLSLHPGIHVLTVLISVRKSKKLVLECCFVFAGVVIGLFFASFLIEGDFYFINAVYKHIVFMVDCTPHLNVYWYLFAEMFDHFRDFFLYVFQCNIFTITVALALRFKDDYLTLSMSLWFVLCIFQSYPAIGELGTLLSMLIAWKHLYKFTRTGMIPVVQLFISSFLAVIMHYLWIVCGVANSNFYFGAVMSHFCALIFIMSDFLGAHFKRQFHLKYGPEPKFSDGSKVVLVLKS